MFGLCPSIRLTPISPWKWLHPFLASAAGAVRRLQLLLDSGRQGLQRALALFLDEKRAVGKRDEIHGIALDLRRGHGGDEVPLPGPGHAVNSGRVPGGRHAAWFGY